MRFPTAQQMEKFPAAPPSSSRPATGGEAASARPVSPFTSGREVMADAFGAPRPDMGQRTFMRMVSHELRTPLNSIIGFSDILSQELYGPLGSAQYVEYAGIIRDSGKRLLTLFNDVLEIVRLENEPDLLRPENDDLRPFLEEAAQHHAAAAAARGVRLSLRADRNDLSARFDPRGLNTCLEQLLRNAVDFTPEGGEIDIHAFRAADTAEIRIFNPGPAPDPADVPRLMRPFEQGAGVLSRTREGAGLGWPLVRLSAGAMGGTFSVQSDPQTGLTAIIRLPA